MAPQSCCPSDREATIEAYLLNTLPMAETQDFERHLLNCSECRTEVTAALAFTEAVREASRRFERARKN
jgi:anti-sigma factor RsiW